MTHQQTVNNVDLVVDIKPNPLGGQPGTHEIWFNNNNSWTAAITSTYVAIQNGASAQLDLVIAGSRVRRRSMVIGNVGAWRSSRAIPTGIAEVAGATSAGEFIDVTCSVSRAPISPSQPPPRLYPLQISTLVSL